MARTRVRWGRIGVLGVSVAASVVLVGSRAGMATGAAGPAEGRAYVVRSGDTLWRIAVRQVGPRSDPRPYVDRLIKLNHLPGATIQEGERLSLPA